jgi:hypothetical protein
MIIYQTNYTINNTANSPDTLIVNNFEDIDLTLKLGKVFSQNQTGKIEYQILDTLKFENIKLHKMVITKENDTVNYAFEFLNNEGWKLPFSQKVVFSQINLEDDTNNFLAVNTLSNRSSILMPTSEVNTVSIEEVSTSNRTSPNLCASPIYESASVETEKNIESIESSGESTIDNEFPNIPISEPENSETNTTAYTTIPVLAE